jgi:hypothetical protein
MPTPLRRGSTIQTLVGLIWRERTGATALGPSANRAGARKNGVDHIIAGTGVAAWSRIKSSAERPIQVRDDVLGGSPSAALQEIEIGSPTRESAS